MALCHALERGTASQYVISSGAASSEALVADIERELGRFEPASMREQIRSSFAAEATLTTVEQARAVAEAQMPFHFWELGDAYSAFVQADKTLYAPEVLAHFAANGYGDIRVGRSPALDPKAHARDRRAMRPTCTWPARRSTTRWRAPSSW